MATPPKSLRRLAGSSWSPEWKQYELPVGSVDLRRVVTPFAVVTDAAHNPSGALTFYLDEIYFVLAPSAGPAPNATNNSVAS